MKKKVKSQKSNAQARGSSNLPLARSRNSAALRSSKSNERELRIATPANIDWLAQSGVIVPDDLEPENESIPLDFTSLNNRRLGATHSRFAVRHAHVLYVRAQNATELVRLKRKHRLALATFRVHNDFKTEKALMNAFARSKIGKRIEAKLEEVEIREILLEAVADGYLDIVKAASREMARRDSERGPRD